MLPALQENAQSSEKYTFDQIHQKTLAFLASALCSFEGLLLRRVNGRCQERLVKDVIYCIRSALLVRGLLGKNAVRWLANKMWRD